MVDLDTIINPDGTINFDPNYTYSTAELDLIATAYLRHDVRDGGSIKGDNPILFEEHFRNRYRREIYNTAGTPDPAFGQGSYNKTHPQGRKVNTDQQRKANGASYYR